MAGNSLPLPTLSKVGRAHVVDVTRGHWQAQPIASQSPNLSRTYTARTYKSERRKNSWGQQSFASVATSISPSFISDRVPIQWGKSELPYYEKALTGRNVAVCNLAFVWLGGISCFLYGCVATGQHSIIMLSKGRSRSVGLLVACLALTASIRSMSFLHAASLRWTLFRDRKLSYNSNVFFMTNSSSSWIHKWYSNAFFLSCIVVSYVSLAQIFHVRNSGPAFTLLGLSLVGQALIAACCLLASQVPTWSSNPVNNALTAMHQGQAHMGNRGMLSVADFEKPSHASLPLAIQPTAAAAIRRVNTFSQVVRGLVLGVLIIMIVGLVVRRDPVISFGYSFLYCYRNTLSDNGELFGYIFLISISQLLFTAATMLVEFQALCLRDEQLWRAIGRTEGLSPFSSAMGIMSLNAVEILSFLLAVLVHWLFSLTISDSFTFNPANMVLLTVAMLALLALSTYCSFWKPYGPLPATYGHIPTIANLVDDWALRMWWGEKEYETSLPNVRRAGTSGMQLRAIRMDIKYM